jgi:uncharacterized protein YbjT (DUF2867 family)
MILLAGGTGVLGTEVARLLEARGESLRVLTRDPARAAHLSGHSRGRARRPCGPLPPCPPRWLGCGRWCSRQMVLPPAAVVALARSTGTGPGPCSPPGQEVSHVVLLSTLAAGADHPMELARMKYAAEQAVRSWSQPGRNAAEHRQDATQPGVADEQPARTWTIIRPAAYLETWLMVAGGPLLHGKPAVIFGRGRNPINFVAARDVARVVERAVRTPELHGLTLELTGPADLTLRDLAATMASAIGCPRAVRRVPLPVMRVASHLLRAVRPDVARLIRAGVIMDTTHMTAGAGADTVRSQSANNTSVFQHSAINAFPEGTINLIQPTALAEIATALAAAHRERIQPPTENGAESPPAGADFAPGTGQ